MPDCSSIAGSLAALLVTCYSCVSGSSGGNKLGSSLSVRAFGLTCFCFGLILVPVRLAWTSKMYGGKFKGRQPEALNQQEWQVIREWLTNGKAEGWAFG